jgi:hypothetical protein
MPFVPVPNTALVELRMTFDSQQVENTLWFEFGSDPDAAVLTTLASELESWWVGQYAPLISEQVVLREVVATNMSSASSVQVAQVAAGLETGTQTSPPLPSNASLTVSFRTGLRGRSFRGRNYIVGLTEDTNTGNQINAVYLSSVRDAYANLLPGIGAPTGATWVVASRFSGVTGAGVPIPRATGVTTPITTVVIVDDIIDSQRRRLPGRGN